MWGVGIVHNPHMPSSLMSVGFFQYGQPLTITLLGVEIIHIPCHTTTIRLMKSRNRRVWIMQWGYCPKTTEFSGCFIIACSYGPCKPTNEDPIPRGKIRTSSNGLWAIIVFREITESCKPQNL